MYFAYLTLPKIPEKFIESCYKNIDLIDVDPRLESVNAPRGVMNRGTFIPTPLMSWIIDNIATPFFPDRIDDLKKSLVNVTKYSKADFKDPAWYGSHGKHVDIGRHYALNYYFDLGGDNTRIEWYADDKKTLLAKKENLIPHTWVLLKVNPTVHAVRNIDPTGLRVSISLSIIIDDLKNFNEEEYFSHVVVKDSIIK